MFPFKTALNASTLFPFKLNVKEQISVAAEAGYQGIELWVKDIDAYVAAGGTISELRRYISDTGIAVVNAIAFFAWTDEDQRTREQAFIQADKEMRMLAELGCAAIAAPPFGNVEQVSLDAMAANFAKLADMAGDIGIKPYLEFWGRAKRLSTLSEAVYVAMKSGVADARLLLDPFHMYVGGSSIDGIAFMNGARIGIVHVNDYPAAPDRASIADRERVFPGEGIGPSRKLAETLFESGYSGHLSLELFMENFGGKSALEVARHGLDTMARAYRIET